MRPYLLILIVLSIFLIFFHLGVRPLLSSGEARASEIALEMMQRGNIFVPFLNEEVLLTKPPLFHWFIILFYKILGVCELASRMPSAIAGVFTVIVVFLLGKRLWGEKLGFIAGLLLLTSPTFFWSVRCARIDGFLLFLVTMSIYCFWRAYENFPRGKSWFVLWFIFMALGFLAKGPIGIAAPLGTGVLFLWHRGRKDVLKKIPWLWGFLIIFGIIGPWFATIAFFVPKVNAEKFFVVQNKAWFSGEGNWYKGYVYIFHLLLGFFPWSVAIPAAIALTWKDFWKKLDEKKGFLWIWFLLVFCVFAFMGKKVSRYILPAYPAMALLLAHTINEKNIFKTLFSWINIVVGIFVIIAARLVINVVPSFISNEFSDLLIKHIGVNIIWISALSLVVIIFGILGLRKRSFVLACCGVIVLINMFILFIVPLEKEYYSPKPFCVMLKEKVPENLQIKAYNSWDNTIRYYYGRHVDIMRKDSELMAYLDQPEQVYCIMWRKVYDELPKDIKGKIEIISDDYNVIDRKMILTRSKPR